VVTKRIVNVGIIGLGGAAIGMVGKFASNAGYRVAAAADLDTEILGAFSKDFPDAKVTTDAQELCKNPAVDLVYIATPNRFHSEHADMALTNGKHVLTEKPMTLTIPEAETMIQTAERNGVLLGVNVKHSFEPRIQRIRQMVTSGELGQLRMMHHWRYQDWIYRPRTPEELTPEMGGGILWRQGPHQFDIIRTICGGLVRSVRGVSAIWDLSRRVAGAHSAFLDFEDGVVATGVYSGYDHWDSRELVQGVGKEGVTPDPAKHATARKEQRAASDPSWEASAARAERYGLGRTVRPQENPPRQPGRSGWILGGPMVVSFDRGDVRLTPNGLVVYGDENRTEIPLATEFDGQDGRINTFHAAITEYHPLAADGRWGMATLELLLAVELSGLERREIFLEHQVATVD
jgi:phthalate 4,5-cis-dihydrodiol dehydrogenase